MTLDAGSCSAKGSGSMSPRAAKTPEALTEAGHAFLRVGTKTSVVFSDGELTRLTSKRFCPLVLVDGLQSKTGQEALFSFDVSQVRQRKEGSAPACWDRAEG